MKKEILVKLNKLLSLDLLIDNHNELRSRSQHIIRCLKNEQIHIGLKKFKAQSYVSSQSTIKIKHIISLVILPIFLLYNIIISFKYDNHNNLSEHCYLTAGNKLLETYAGLHAKQYQLNNHIFIDQYKIGRLIDKNFIRFLILLINCNKHLLLQPHLFLIIVTKCSVYNNIIIKHSCQSIYSFNERSLAGPFVTEYLNFLGVKHNLIMHGYRDFNAKDSFCFYDSMYVFGPHYVDLFKKLQCKTKKYEIMGHLELNDHPNVRNQEKNYIEGSIIIVLQPEEHFPSEDLKSFYEMLTEIHTNLSIKVKKRPDGKNWSAKYIPEVKEVPQNNKFEVLSSYDCFAGVFSTLLLEAWACNNKIILIGKNVFSTSMVYGKNVLRLSLRKDKGDHEKKALLDFLSTPIDTFEQIHQRLYSKTIYTINTDQQFGG